MAFNKNGADFWHQLKCENDKMHWLATRGMWFGVDEKICPIHRTLATVLKSNLREIDKQEKEKGN